MKQLKINKSEILLLFVACKSENETAIKYLIEYGTNINKTNNEYETLLFITYPICK